MILQLKKRFSEGFMISAHHTWSKAIDENTDYNSSFEPHLQWDARSERALSSYHRAHRFVAHTVVDFPWKTANGSGFVHNLLSDFTLSGILTARSFAPFNLNAGYDNIGDRHTDTHRPWSLGRNTGIGPNFFTLDIRLMRQFPLGLDRNIQVVAEAFNLLNRTNFRHVNSIVGKLSLEELPASLESRRGPVSEPFRTPRHSSRGSSSFATSQFLSAALVKVFAPGRASDAVPRCHVACRRPILEASTPRRS